MPVVGCRRGGTWQVPAIMANANKSCTRCRAMASEGQLLCTHRCGHLLCETCWFRNPPGEENVVNVLRDGIPEKAQRDFPVRGDDAHSSGSGCADANNQEDPTHGVFVQQCDVQSSSSTDRHGKKRSIHFHASGSGGGSNTFNKKPAVDNNNTGSQNTKAMDSFLHEKKLVEMMKQERLQWDILEKMLEKLNSSTLNAVTREFYENQVQVMNDALSRTRNRTQNFMSSLNHNGGGSSDNFTSPGTASSTSTPSTPTSPE